MVNDILVGAEIPVVVPVAVAAAAVVIDAVATNGPTWRNEFYKKYGPSLRPAGP